MELYYETFTTFYLIEIHRLLFSSQFAGFNYSASYTGCFQAEREMSILNMFCNLIQF